MAVVVHSDDGGANNSITLVSADTPYAVPDPSPTGKFTIILYNGSDTDMFMGFQNAAANGISLPSGGRIAIDLHKSRKVFCYCGSPGKVLSYTTLEI